METFIQPRQRVEGHFVRRGFTLVELLVTIAVIAILASLLLPTLSRAKSAGQRTKCLNNVRQITLANALYLSDFSAYPVFLGIYGTNWTYWAFELKPYLISNWDDPIFHCPGFPRANKAPFLWSSPNLGLGANSGEGCYDMNAWGVGFTAFIGIDVLGLGGYDCGPEFHGIKSCPESRVIVPSEMLAYGDVCEDPHYLKSGRGYFDVRGHSYDSSSPSEMQQRDHARLIRRHESLYNIGSCDGHVESGKPQKFFAPRDEVIRRWNNDHEPHRELWPDYWPKN